MTLNKIIYRLFILLLLEFSIFGMYVIMENLSVKEVSSEQRVHVDTSNISLYVDEAFTKEIIQIKPKTLDEVLIEVEPSSELDILSMKNQMVKPVIYTKSIKLSDLSIEDKKKTFIDMMIPSILVAKHRITEERKKVKELLTVKEISSSDALWLTKKRYIFKASSIDELYEKMELHPTSIIIAQAIIESGWGTSRFFEQANNVFGIWSFNEHEKRIAASQKRGDKTIYLKKYRNMEQSIYDYFLMLSTKEAYKEFREKRLESQDPFVLVEQLGKYSELGDEYIENLKNTIKKNQLLAYDNYSLDI